MKLLARSSRALAVVITGAALGLGLAQTSAHAKTVVDDDDQTKTLQCLTRSGEAPVYPPEDLKRRLDGFYRIKLGFMASDRAPEVAFIFKAGSERQREEIERFAQSYRLPCLQPGERLEVVQEFKFNASDFGQIVLVKFFRTQR